MKSIINENGARLGLSLVSALGMLFFGGVSAFADQYTNAVQVQLNTLFPGKNYQVSGIPLAPSKSLIAATNAAIAADMSHAHNYVGSVLGVRTDALTIATAMVTGAETAIGGLSANVTEAGLIAGSAAGVAGLTLTTKSAITNAAITAVPNALSDILTNVVPFIASADKNAFVTAVARGKAVSAFPAKVAILANIVAASTDTLAKKAAVSAAAIAATKNAATLISQSVATLFSTGSDQVLFARTLASISSSANAGAIAAGVSLTNVSFSARIVSQVVQASAATLISPGAIAGAVMKVVPSEYACDIATELGELINAGTLNVTTATSIATNLVSAPNVKVDTGEITEITSTLLSFIPSPVLNSKTILGLLAAVLKLNPLASDRVAGSVAQAVVNFYTTLTLAQRNSLLDQINLTILKAAPTTLDAQVTANINAVRNGTQTFPVGCVDSAETPSANF